MREICRVFLKQNMILCIRQKELHDLLSNWQNGERCYNQKPFCVWKVKQNVVGLTQPYDPTWTGMNMLHQRKEKESSLGPSTNCGRPVGPSCWCRWQILSLQPYPALTDALLTFQWLIMDSLLWRNSSLGDDSFHWQNVLHSCIHTSHCRQIRLWLPSLYCALIDRKGQ